MESQRKGKDVVIVVLVEYEVIVVIVVLVVIVVFFIIEDYDRMIRIILLTTISCTHLDIVHSSQYV